MRGNAGKIGQKANTSLSNSGGVFNIIDVQLQESVGIWPKSGADFTIDPGYSGKLLWEFNNDGDLNIGSYGQYTITITKSFSALVKMWGAGGARGFNYTQTISSTDRQGDGGAGGFSNATITFTAGQTFVLQIGQGGARVTTTSNGATYLAGGTPITTGNHTQGGGYTGLFINSVSQGNAWLIAGGGGAGGDSNYGTGGGGGGSSGANSSGGVQGGNGGTQIAGGGPSIYNGATAGAALTGGVGGNTSVGLGGGGGGYYGGGGGNVGGGGGGSGYYSSNTALSGAATTGTSNSTPANSGDTDRNGAGVGGNATQGNTGAGGRLLIRFLNYV